MPALPHASSPCSWFGLFDGHGWGLPLGITTALLLLGLAWLLRGTGRPALADDEPLAILRRRYARGEIDAETFQRMRRELRS